MRARRGVRELCVARAVVPFTVVVLIGYLQLRESCRLLGAWGAVRCLAIGSLLIWLLVGAAVCSAC